MLYPVTPITRHLSPVPALPPLCTPPRAAVRTIRTLIDRGTEPGFAVCLAAELHLLNPEQTVILARLVLLDPPTA